MSTHRKTGALRRAFATTLTLILAIVGLSAIAPAASAATPGIVVNVLHNGNVLADGATVPEGANLLLRVQYDRAQGIDGKEVTVTLPGGIVAPSIPAGNEAIEQIRQNDDDSITIIFKDPIPVDVAEGAIALQLKASNVDNDTDAPISWEVDGDSTGVTIVIEDQVVPPTPEVVVSEDWSKSVNPGNLDSLYSFTIVDGEYVFAGLKDEILERELTYTLRIATPPGEGRSNYSVADQLPAGLSYVANSFSAKLTTYNPEQTTTVAFTPEISGNSFSGSITVPENSRFEITYKVKVTDKSELESLIEEAFEARTDPGASGWVQIWVKNTATFGGTVTKDASVRVGGTVPGVGVGNAFAKDGSWSERNVVANEEGTLTPPAEITYSLKANLTPWTGDSNNLTLGYDIVITDTLVDQASWNTSDPDFITATGLPTDVTLTKVEGTWESAHEFSTSTTPGDYAVDGQTLMVNVGQDNTTNAIIKVKAQLNTVDGLSQQGSTTITGGVPYLFPNSASFQYSQSGTHNDGHDATVVVLPEGHEDEGVQDTRTFAKAGPDGDIRVSPGQSAQVPYRFTVDTARAELDPTQSKIVDYADGDYFDLSDLSAVGVSGSYGGTALNANHFALSTDADGNLVIVLSEAGVELVQSLDEGKVWIVDIVLPTVVFEGKETLEIHNRAVLYGEDDSPTYWDDDDSEATSYGDEAELRKRVYDSDTSTWTAALDAKIVEGEFVNDTFVYSIEVIPRGSYGVDFPVQIFSREDILPDSLEFLGFVDVDDSGAPLLETVSDGPDSVPGNVVATYADGVVTVSQVEGTNLNRNQGRIVTYFAVKATTADEPIVNTIIGSSTTIDPYGDPSIDIEKWTNEGDGSGPAYDAAGKLTNDGYAGDFDSEPGKLLDPAASQQINFTISNDGREDLKDIVVSDALTGGTGNVDGLVCTFPDESTGTTWAGPFEVGTQFDCVGTLPALDWSAEHANEAAVTGVGVFSGTTVSDEDPWSGYTPEVPSIDIEKWTDEGDGSGPAYDADGSLSNDGYDGDFDANEFKELTSDGDQEINFTISNDGTEDLKDIVVSDALSAGTGTVEGLVCTFPDESTGTTWAGPFEVGTQFDCVGTLPALGAGAVHTNTATATGVGVKSGETVDDEDAWNAFTKSYAIGDFVWIDADKDGVQDDDETPLEGVTVDLLDSTGEVIDSTTTDERGRYYFDNLAAGTYQVQFTLTDEQKVLYIFTSQDSGADDARDSDADPASGLTITVVLDDSNEALTSEYEYFEIKASEGIDPTWDAGVILVPAQPELPKAGVDSVAQGLLLGGFLMLAGAGLVYVKKRRIA